jgi:hypothetical protein
VSDPVSDLKQELLAAAERQEGHAPARGSRRRWRGHPGRNRLTLTAATLAIATAVALLVTAPWSSSPGFLARAEAALTPPAGSVLHQTWETTSTWTRAFCTVTRSQGEAWIDGAPPHSYRVLLNDLPDPDNADPRNLGCSSGTASELGGTYSSSLTLRFVPPNRLAAYAVPFRFQLDPAAVLRDLMSAGVAHDEGKTQLDGRTVERIRIDPPSACPFANCPREPAYAYVDPETFYPVEIVVTRYQIEIVGGPGTSSYSRVGVRDVMRFSIFEYLPQTAANLALTDIHAQHPNATGP